MHSYNTDVLDTNIDYNVNRCDTNVSHPLRLCLPQRHVRAFYPSIILQAYCGQYYNSGNNSKRVPRSGLSISHPTMALNTHNLNRIEVAVHTTCEQYVAPPKRQAGSLASMDGQLHDKQRDLSLDADAKDSV
jgi:hypothetical protein